MNEILYGRMPTIRGFYLFTWGWVYFAMGSFTLTQTDSTIQPVMSTIFSLSGLAVLVMAWVPQSHTLAFSFLSGVAIFTAFSFLFPYFSTSRYSAVSNFIIYHGIALTHYLTSKWSPHQPIGTLPVFLIRKLLSRKR